jgi:D-xylono/L-arabinono-1,4-lactonase
MQAEACTTNPPRLKLQGGVNTSSSHRSPAVECIADYACHIGEGPVWHAAEKRLYWVDILSPRIFAYTPSTRETKEYRQDRPVGGFTVQADGSLLLFRDRGNIVTWRDGREIATVVNAIPGEQAQRFNDVIADPQGRVFAGTLTMSGEWDDITHRTGRMYRIERDGSCRMLFDGIGISNGMGFSPDLRHLYFIDSLDRTISRFDYDLATGDLNNRRLLVQFGADDGCPDGMTVDENGDLWVAMVFAGCVARYAPDGKERPRLAVPTSFVTSLTFGGEDFSRMFVVTGKGDEREKFGPLAGATFELNPEARGRAEFESRIQL